jgi:hypothetical protein
VPRGARGLDSRRAQSLKHLKSTSALPDKRKEYVEHHPAKEQARAFPGLAAPDTSGLTIEEAVKADAVKVLPSAAAAAAPAKGQRLTAGARADRGEGCTEAAARR